MLGEYPPADFRPGESGVTFRLSRDTSQHGKTIRHSYSRRRTRDFHNGRGISQGANREFSNERELNREFKAEVTQPDAEAKCETGVYTISSRFSRAKFRI